MLKKMPSGGGEVLKYLFSRIREVFKAVQIIVELNL
jgi:hypothetical protein